ncbi:MAG TPA: amidohydrolase [Rhodobacteraceae bacterium]|jgi:hippurate hydrolase|nr:M20 family metallopeptidase [Paracoccaceae bacterium]HBR60960.1 amidohydrolase [Paracoccaceae bacterium]|tara:strand:- start:79 stop:1248 length:1170 start_codon:yes stop_codon:yes gene_type:complete
MNILPIIAAAEEELCDIFEMLHAHPEIGFEEHKTSQIVAERLRAFGVDEVHTGIGNTGVVGLLHGKGRGNRRIGLRADMDALPIHENTGLSYQSTQSGKMHACGHDGHTTMLLGAAKHLAETRDFDGSVALIFQPAEEGLGGALAMMEQGLFQKFPCDEIYGMHNAPNGRPGRFEICKGRAMAGAAFFDIVISGLGSHAALPHQSRDPIVIASGLVSQIQSIVSRNVAPLETCVLSVTQIHAGSAYNVVPETATLAGTIRYFEQEVYETATQRLQALCDGFATAFDVDVALELRPLFNVLKNDPNLSQAYLEAASDIVGPENVSTQVAPDTASEDFADMLQVVPGAYCRVGHSGTMPLHNPQFTLGKEILPVGASIMARLVETRLPLEG